MGSYPGSVVLDDFNGDTVPDMAVANQSGATVTIRLGTGSGSFGTASSFATGSTPIGLASGDFNGDTKRDLVV